MTLPAKLNPERLTAIIDTREQTPLDLAPLQTEAGSLPTGDYSLKGLEHVVAIERKSLPDLLGCVGRDRERFEKEMRRLLAYPCRALVLETTKEEIKAGGWRSKVTVAAVEGSLIGWEMLGVHVEYAEDHQGASRYVAKALFTVARRRWREARELVKLHEEAA